MKSRIDGWLFWTPRVLSILFALFVSVFALDAFNEGEDFWKMVRAFLIHLIPAALIVVALVIAWRWEAIGGLLFIALGAVSVAQTRLGWFTLVLFLVGVLFLLSRFLGRTKGDQQQTYGSTL